MSVKSPGDRKGLLSRLWSLTSGVTLRPLETFESIAQGGTGAPTPAAGLLLVGGLGAAAGVTVLAGRARSAGLGWAVTAGALGDALAVALGLVLGVFLAASATIWGISRLLGGRGSFGAIVAAWAGSYVPTIAWFTGLLLAHLIAPLGPEGMVEVDPGSFWFPPGVWFQLVFLAFSLAMFLWKSLLLYLTLRVVGGLDFRRIVVAAFILGLVAVAYWALGLELGWFKVPLI